MTVSSISLGINALASPFTYLALIPVLYWCVDKAKGSILGFAFLASCFLNNYLAIIFSEKAICGILLVAAALWPMMGFWLKGIRGLLVALLPLLLIAFSSAFLGAFMPMELFLSFGIGLAIAACFLLGHKFLSPLIVDSNIRVKIVILASLAFLMNLLDKADTTMAGALLGFGLGILLESSHVAMVPESNSLMKKLLRVACGLAGIALLWFGGEALIPIGGSDFSALATFVRAGLIGFWVSFAAPIFFVSVDLASGKSKRIRDSE